MSPGGRRRWPLAAALAILGGFVALGAPAPAPAAEGGAQVLMVDNEPDLTRWHYDPATVTVSAGSTVVWLNKGKEDHSVRADDRSFDSGLRKTGATFSRVFPRPGTYTYHCEPHPWMKGLIEVKAAAAPTPTAAATTPSSSPAPPTTAAPAPPDTAPAAPGSTAPGAASESPTAPDTAGGGSPDGQEQSEDDAAAPASSSRGSGGHLAGNLALVLLPTLGALALGAKLRQSRS